MVRSKIDFAIIYKMTEFIVSLLTDKLNPSLNEEQKELIHNFAIIPKPFILSNRSPNELYTELTDLQKMWCGLNGRYWILCYKNTDFETIRNLILYNHSTRFPEYFAQDESNILSWIDFLYENYPNLLFDIDMQNFETRYFVQNLKKVKFSDLRILELIGKFENASEDMDSHISIISSAK